MSHKALKVAAGVAVGGGAAALLYAIYHADAEDEPRPVAIWSAPGGLSFKQYKTAGDATCQFNALACGERWFRTGILMDPYSQKGRLAGRQLRGQVADFLDAKIHDPAGWLFVFNINFMRPGMNRGGSSLDGLSQEQMLAFAEDYVSSVRERRYGDEVTLTAFGQLVRGHVNCYDVDPTLPGSLRITSNGSQTDPVRPYALINTNNERGVTEGGRSSICHFELLLPQPPLPGTAARRRR